MAITAATITSRLNHCSGLLMGLLLSTLASLPSILHSAARVVLLKCQTMLPLLRLTIVKGKACPKVRTHRALRSLPPSLLPPPSALLSLPLSLPPLWLRCLQLSFNTAPACRPQAFTPAAPSVLHVHNLPSHPSYFKSLLRLNLLIKASSEKAGGGGLWVKIML